MKLSAPIVAALAIAGCAAPAERPESSVEIVAEDSLCQFNSGCVTAERPAFSVDALVADAPVYVAARYTEGELPAALIADLTAEEFQCQHSATMSECGRARHAFASCWDVVTVRIIATEPVHAEQNRRCMGATR